LCSMAPAEVQTGQAWVVVPQASQALAGLVLPAPVESTCDLEGTLPHQPVIVPQAAQAMAGFGVEHAGQSLSYPIGGAQAFIQVRLGAMPLVEGSKPFREFELTISTGGVEHSMRARFSALERGLAQFATAEIHWPREWFSFLRDYVRDEVNVRRRGEGIRHFLQEVLNARDRGSVIGDPRLHDALQIATGSGMHAALVDISAAIAQQQVEDVYTAQTFNSVVAYSGSRLGSLPTITFPRPQKFELRNRFGGWGDATIKGPGGHGWFRLCRSNPSLFGELFKDAHFTITTMAGEPLLAMQENFRWRNYEYDLFRIDPRTRAHISICRIVRQSSLIAHTDQYVIQHVNHLGGPGHVECSGRWPYRFSLRTGGGLAAQVKKQFSPLTDTYEVEVAPNMDCLLFLGIACAIDRIHHEVEDARRRQLEERRRLHDGRRPGHQKPKGASEVGLALSKTKLLNRQMQCRMRSYR